MGGAHVKIFASLLRCNMAATTPEGKVKKLFDKMVKEEGAYYIATKAGVYGTAGVPDRVVVANGFFIGVEIKAGKTKKLTPLQEKEKCRILMSGGIFFTVYDDETIEKVRACIHDCNATDRSPFIQAERPREDPNDGSVS